jgi:hypothetical protein
MVMRTAGRMGVAVTMVMVVVMIVAVVGVIVVRAGVSHGPISHPRA